MEPSHRHLCALLRISNRGLSDFLRRQKTDHVLLDIRSPVCCPVRPSGVLFAKLVFACYQNLNPRKELRLNF